MYQLINWTEPMEEDHHKTDFVFPRSKKREIKNTEVNGWEARKLALGVFSIVPYLFLTNLLGASDLTQAAIVAGGSIATGALLPEAIDYVRRKLTWNEFHGEVTRYYSSEKVLEAVVKTMERIPISERKHLAGKLKEIGEANDKMLSPYEMLEVAKGKIYDSLNTEIIYNSADFTKDEDIEKFIVSCLDTLGGQWVSNKDYFSATRYLISKKLISPEIGIEFICKRSEIDLEQYAEKEGYESVESMISDYKQPYNEYSHTASSSYKAIEIIEQMLKRRTQKTINVTIDSLKPGEDYNSPSEYLQKLIELEEDRVQKKSKPQTAMPSSQTPIKFRRVRGPKNNLFVYKDNRFGY